MKHLFLITLLSISLVEAAEKQLTTGKKTDLLTAEQMLAGLSEQERKEIFFILLPKFLQEDDEKVSMKNAETQTEDGFQGLQGLQGFVNDLDAGERDERETNIQEPKKQSLVPPKFDPASRLGLLFKNLSDLFSENS